MSTITAQFLRNAAAQGWAKLCRSTGICLVLALGTGLTALNFPAAAVALAQEESSVSPFASPAYIQSLMAAAKGDEMLEAFYRSRDFAPIWTSAADGKRRAALLGALDKAEDHGLPKARYDAEALRRDLAAVATAGDLGRIEVRMSRAYLDWARDLSSGLLDPAKIDPTIVRGIARPDPQDLLARIATGDPAAVMAGFVPKSDAYVQLMQARLDLLEAVRSGAWGPQVAAQSLKPGDRGAAVVALRDRLIRMGYLRPTALADYGPELQAAVRLFQSAHGLPADGVAGSATMAEINKGPEERLKSVLVAMERERWLDIDRSGRMIWVNLPDFTAKIVDDGRVTFRTRAVIGREDKDRRTPEFSDMMDHMVVNPSWGVPRSIVVGEYLPLMQRNPNAASHIQVVDRRGRVVSRGSVNFAAYNARNFPYAMRQAPGDANALGKVKFMFPNKYNIYLHDTPSKSLFANDRRAYSHGCIRLADPFDFAHALFRSQSEAIEEEFNATLKTGRETPVKLERQVPIHLVYFTAYPEGKGKMGYRRDVYDRDARLWSALAAAGVALEPVSQ